jgi:hypothetical protein
LGVRQTGVGVYFWVLTCFCIFRFFNIFVF